MEIPFKPEGYNSLSPYLIVDNAPKLVALLQTVFGATVLRKYEHKDGKIMHIELRLDDTVLMISDSTEAYPARQTMLHMYVPDVFATFQLAIDNGCEAIDKPTNKEGDPDIRGSFFDYAKNYWAVATQKS